MRAEICRGKRGEQWRRTHWALAMIVWCTPGLSSIPVTDFLLLARSCRMTV
ncbi:hypothetical protein FA95DRAFT_1564409, partial [Auriscalpium vulgare]